MRSFLEMLTAVHLDRSGYRVSVVGEQPAA